MELRVAQSALAIRSSAGVGMTPPKVLGAPKPTSSVMIEQHVRRALGRHDSRRPPRLGLLGVDA